MTIFLSDMAEGDPALVTHPRDRYYPKAAAARLAHPQADDLVVALGSQVWLVPGPLVPAGQPSGHESTSLGAQPLVPRHRSVTGVWQSVAFGDFDQDGRLDMALAHSSSGGNVLLLGQVDATPRCLCGPAGVCNANPEDPYQEPTCECEDPKADLDFPLARGERVAR
ncbi:hypothetical protein H696_06106 [Fonticula alba]|uniref:Uncharacterized protein n=1 Tax=Fonticula alba TaxID=691883 RepID=A0A058Z1W3_FONAL|nr:hypothetical protein H696_06106 [Fonticula alba]KCV67467.1 hypothetical protein H696_06106 [Fonticula alba]|eukprot:XP_009498143.1 hypothetical protein H696_06106 [Fonticula alba]